MTANGAPKKWQKRTRWLVASAVVLLAIVARPAWHLLRAVKNDPASLPQIPVGFVNDARRLNQTKVQQVWDIPPDTAAAEKQLAELLAVARRDKLPVSIAGARHSMGGHTIAPDGIVINMRPFRGMNLNDTKDRLQVQAGAFWEEIIPYLDERGCSVAVMQSNNSFSVGGSISVNCHGWQFGRPPIASSVESFRLMKADGQIVICRRDENAELFSLVLGGYGLFGVILDVELRVAPNARYRMEQYLVTATDALTTFDQQVVNRPDVEMVAVDEAISRADNLRPRNVGTLSVCFFGQTGRRFADDFHETDHRKLKQPIGVQFAARSTLRKLDSLTASVEHVSQANRIVMVRHTNPLPEPARHPENTC